MNNLPKKAGIYKITNKFNGKIYIGQTNNFNRRFNEYNSRSHRQHYKNNYFINAINKYGFNNFIMEIIDHFDIINPIELTALETAYIEFYDSTDKKIGYNTCIISSINFGKPISKEHKKKISDTLKQRYKNENHHNLGRPQSQEHIDKRISCYTKTWKLLSPEGKVIEVYNLNKFCKENGLKNSCMSNVLNGVKSRHQHKGWRKV